MQPSIEIALRVGAFCVVFLPLVVLEIWAPRRFLRVGRISRWPGNLGILIIDALAVRLLLPAAAFGAALIAEERGFGLFNLLGLPYWVRAVLGFLLLDLAIYAQHVGFHHLPLLWRLHRIHHTDLDVDVTTGLRFHPLEILISMLIKIAVVVAAGIPPGAVLVFEIVLNASSMFGHANLSLPPALDRAIRWFVVTPDMHRVHHSILRDETDSNFGFNLPWWDHLFGTYRPEPRAGQVDATLGLPIFRAAKELRLDNLLTQPFRNPPAAGDGPRGQG